MYKAFDKSGALLGVYQSYWAAENTCLELGGTVKDNDGNILFESDGVT